MRNFRYFLFGVTVMSSTACLSAPCTGDEYLKVASGRFSLCLPLSFYRNATIGKGDDLLVKRSDGSFFGIKTINAASDNLPPTFDMRIYPEHNLGLAKPEALSTEQAAALANTRAAIKSHFGSAQPKKFSEGGKTIYTITSAQSTDAYVVRNDVTEQILFLTFEKMDEKTVKSIIGGIQ